MSDLPIDLQALAALAGISLEPGDEVHLTGELEAMLRLADSLPLAEVSPETLESWVSETTRETPRRRDTPRQGASNDESSPLVADAPGSRGAFFALPRLIDG